MSYRIGSGIDFHRLAADRELWIGGVRIPHHKGAVGHSDADVLLHAICDALLGAACLGDIGLHFPNTSLQYKDVDSKILLKKTVELIHKANFRIVNVDSTVCAEEPTIRPYVDEMRNAIANILSVSSDDVSIKATTTEKLGFIGREEGIAAFATTMLEKT